MNRIRNFLKADQGATAIEYAMICAVIVLVMIVGLRALSGANGDKWTNTSDRVGSAMSGN